VVKSKNNIMRTLLNKKQRADFLSKYWHIKTLNFKWTISKARNTYGYNICTLKDSRGNKISSTCGGGYDMKGTCLGDFINTYFYDEIRKLNSADFYGLKHYGKKYRRLKHASKHGKSYVDGGCGFSTMESILNKIGFKLSFVLENNNKIIYNLKSI
jgi:hypothetical protein